MIALIATLAVIAAPSTGRTCDQIRGTEYLDWPERDYYLSVCLQRPPAFEHLLRIRHCESGDDYDIDTENGYFGAYQFSQSTWNSVIVNAGYPDWFGVPPNYAPDYVQDAAALELYNEDGPSQWPVCGLL